MLIYEAVQATAPTLEECGIAAPVTLSLLTTIALLQYSTYHDIRVCTMIALTAQSLTSDS